MLSAERVNEVEFVNRRAGLRPERARHANKFLNNPVTDVMRQSMINISERKRKIFYRNSRRETSGSRRDSCA